MPAAITLLIAHPKELIRAGLRAMLAQSPIRIIGEAHDTQTTLALAKKHKPAVALIDIGIAGEADSFEFVKRLLESVPGTQAILLSALDNPTYMARAKAAGASDFLPEGLAASDLTKAIENAAAGRPSKGSFARVVAAMNAKPGVDKGKVKLAPRESQVLTHLALGLSNDEIARSLGISVETVKETVQRILRKLAVVDRTQAAVWAVKSGVA